MTYLLIILGIAFSVLMLLQIIAPFLSSRKDQLRFEILDDDLRQIEALVSRKVALVQTLRDLEYDFETAKITEEDYLRFKRSCERQAVGVMRRLDAIHGGRDWESVIEEALQQRLQDNEVAAPSSSSLAPIAPAVDSSISESPACSQCGAPLKEDDLFCSKCGTPVHGSNDDGANDDGSNGLELESDDRTPTAESSEPSVDELDLSTAPAATSSAAALLR